MLRFLVNTNGFSIGPKIDNLKGIKINRPIRDMWYGKDEGEPGGRSFG